MTLRVEVAPSALRQLRELAPPASEGEWRVHTGDHRIVYQVHDAVLLVLVVGVGHRRDIYGRH